MEESLPKGTNIKLLVVASHYPEAIELTVEELAVVAEIVTEVHSCFLTTTPLFALLVLRRCDVIEGSTLAFGGLLDGRHHRLEFSLLTICPHRHLHLLLVVVLYRSQRVLDLLPQPLNVDFLLVW